MRLHIIITQPAHHLAGKQPDRVVGADAVSVRSEQDHVLGAVGDWLNGQTLGDGCLTVYEPLAVSLWQVLGEGRHAKRDECGAGKQGSQHGNLRGERTGPIG